MSAQRPGYDRWRDVSGIHIPIGARVQQISVEKARGALPSRLHRYSEVIAYGRDCQLHVRFDGEDRVVTIRPHLVQLMPIVTGAQIGAMIRDLRNIVPGPRTEQS